MTGVAPSVAVLVSAGRHPSSGKPRACPGDAVVLALGRKIAGEALHVIHAGSPGEPALADYLALGAGKVEVLPLQEGGDAVPALVSCLDRFDVILTGLSAERGEGSGVLPYAVAKSLGRAIASNVIEAKVSCGEIQVRQFLPKGKRRSLAVPMPCVITVHPLTTLRLGYAYARRHAGTVSTIDPSGDGVVSAPSVPNPWTLQPANRQLVRLRAADKKPAHARLQSAIAPQSKGGVVVIEGSNDEKAKAVLDYLRDHRLIEFEV